ncbi:hypothetical protein NG819_02975 [Pseudarthrobacter sp. Fe7]|nr:hypothetical protein NG819_02975 [Pseudarthrobacter sp. Fe7]
MLFVAAAANAHLLLDPVDAELARRSSSPGGIIPPRGRNHHPEAG